MTVLNDRLEEARLQCMVAAIRIGVMDDTDPEKDAHELGWNAAISHMAIAGLLKEDNSND